MGLENLPHVSDAVIVEGAKALPPLSALAFYGMTLEKWLLLLPALYYLALLVDLVFRRWVFPLCRIWAARRKERNGHDAG